jgi:hypothetical protein
VASAEDVRRLLDASGPREVIRLYFERDRRVYITDFILR